MYTPSEKTALNFCKSTVWNSARWIATSYQFHPSGDAPPIMGLVFADWTKGVGLFETWIQEFGNADEHDDLRVAIIEGDVPGQTAGYTVRISPSLNEYLDQDEAPLVGRAVRMHPQFGNAPDMLSQFKRDYHRHGEFMLAPVVQRDDDQLYMNVHKGIIKRELIIRHVSEIGPDEPDMLAVRECDDEKVMKQAAQQFQRMLEEQSQ